MSVTISLKDKDNTPHTYTVNRGVRLLNGSNQYVNYTPEATTMTATQLCTIVRQALNTVPKDLWRIHVIETDGMSFVDSGYGIKAPFREDARYSNAALVDIWQTSIDNVDEIHDYMVALSTDGYSTSLATHLAKAIANLCRTGNYIPPEYPFEAIGDTVLGPASFQDVVTGETQDAARLTIYVKYDGYIYEIHVQATADGDVVVFSDGWSDPPAVDYAQKTQAEFDALFPINPDSEQS